MGVVVSTVSRPPMRFRSRSYMAFVLAPEPPIVEWLGEIDSCLQRSAGFFVGRPTVLDLSAVTLSTSAIEHLIGELRARDIRIMGLEGADPAQLGPDLPPVLKGGRAAASVDAFDATTYRKTLMPPVPPKEPASLLLDSPVRSGQSVIFPSGDVTVLGSVASGAEVIAGGSIHVYGTLRGRAMAGSAGNPRARIFCRKVEAELLAIDGMYTTAEQMDASLRSRPIQAWLDGNAIMITALD
jgi:septum site-determining protein MinC